MRAVLNTLALLALFGANPADAALVLDNTGGKTATLQLPSVSSSLASGPGGWAFSVTGSPYTISEIVFGLYANGTGLGNFGVRLFSGSSTSGTILEDTGLALRALDTLANGGSYTTWAGLDWALAAGNYTIAAYYGNGGTQTARLAITGTSISSGSGITALNAVKGTGSSSDNYAIWVQGTSVSEPPIIALLIAGMIVIGRFSARRSQPARLR